MKSIPQEGISDGGKRILFLSGRIGKIARKTVEAAGSIGRPRPLELGVVQIGSQAMGGISRGRGRRLHTGRH